MGISNNRLFARHSREALFNSEAGQAGIQVASTQDQNGSLRSKDDEALRRARAVAEEAKVALGKRGPVWWTGGAADLHRHMVANGPCSAWYGSTVQRESLREQGERRGSDVVQG
jgi:hypothetical protein